MTKQEKRICAVSLLIIGAALLLFLPEAATAGALFCAWGAVALFPRKPAARNRKISI